MNVRTNLASKIEVRLSDEDEARVKEAAKREGMNVSAWLRRAAYRTAMEEERERRGRELRY
jgi:uncharacterized protein (DUF1778 family)